MYTDRQTIFDLALDQDAEGGAGVLGILDRTRTAAGSRTLRERLLHPASDPDLLRMSLDGVRFLADIDPPTPIDGSNVRAVTRYLESRILGLEERGMRPGMAEAAWISLRDPELLALATEGVPRVAQLVDYLAAVVPPLLSAHPPRGLAVVLESITGLLGKLNLSAPWAGRTRPWDLLRADQRIRVRHHGDLSRLLNLVAELDVQFCLAELVREGFVVPRVESTRELLVDLSDAWYPLVADPVANSFRADVTRGAILITGPNMAGKTTYLRAVGLCVHLAHCGIPVPARAMTFAPLEALFVSLNPRDSPQRGVSLYMAEVLRVRAVIEEAMGGRRVLAIFDELFRGTNQSDALEASRLVLSAAAACPHLGLVVSSHLSELAEEVDGRPGIGTACFEAEVTDDALDFDYLLREGTSSQRLGLELFRRTGLGEMLKVLSSGEGAPAEAPRTRSLPST